MGDWAENQLRGILEILGLPVKGTYHPGEVQLILGVSESTFRRLITNFERNSQGRPIHKNSLDSFRTNGHYRVRFDELARYLRDNNTHQQNCQARTKPGKNLASNR